MQNVYSIVVFKIETTGNEDYEKVVTYLSPMSSFNHLNSQTVSFAFVLILSMAVFWDAETRGSLSIFFTNVTLLKTYLPLKKLSFFPVLSIYLLLKLFMVFLYRKLKNFEDLLKKLVFLVRYLCWVDLQFSG